MAVAYCPSIKTFSYKSLKIIVAIVDCVVLAAILQNEESSFPKDLGVLKSLQKIREVIFS